MEKYLRQKQMGNKFKFILNGSVAVIAGGIWLAMYSANLREPDYNGKSLSYWIEELNGAGSFNQAAEATNAIRTIGTNGLPWLMERMKQQDGRWRRGFYRFVNTIEFIKLNNDTDDTRRGGIRVAFEVLGTNAAPVLPELMTLLDHHHTWQNALAAIFVIGENSVSNLTKACSHTNHYVRADAALLLTKARGGERSLIISWTTMRGSSRQHIQSFWAAGKAEVEALIAQLKNPNRDVRRASAEALMRYAKVSSSAKADLSESLDDHDMLVRSAAAAALKVINPNYQIQQRPKRQQSTSEP